MMRNQPAVPSRRRSPLSRALKVAAASAAAILAAPAVLPGLGGVAQAQIEPTPYPVSWELRFKPEIPKRIVVEPAGGGLPKAYWYMQYAVTNFTDREQTFLPSFTLVTQDGKTFPSDRTIPPRVFEAIKAKSGVRGLQPALKIAGPILVGEDQTKIGVAIWEEPNPQMGTFSVYVQGLSGETAVAKDSSGNPITGADSQPVLLFKTRELNYKVRGDAIYPGEDKVDFVGGRWVMR